MGQAPAVEQTPEKRPSTLSEESNDTQNGLYIPIKIFNIEAEALLDTGSSISVLSPKLFERIPDSIKPMISPSDRSLRMANGDTTLPRGNAIFELSINDTNLRHKMTIADIEVPVIIGYDFLYEHDCSINIKDNCLRFGQDNIKCHPRSQYVSSVFRICLAETVTVPPGTEKIVKGKIDKEDYCFSPVSEVIIESKSDSVLAKQGILVAKALVNPNNSSVPLRVMNLTSKPQLLYTKTVAATAELVESVTELENNSCDLDPCDLVNSVQDFDPLHLPEHLRIVWESNAGSLNDAQRVIFFNLLIKHQEVFAKSKYDLGRTDLVQHEINTGNHRPIKQHVRRLPLNKREIVEKEVQVMLEHGIIEPSKSAWSSPIVLVEKKDHTTRFCLDYRALNEITQKDSYPLPRIDDCFDALGGTTWFSSIDLQSGYWQVAMNPDDAPKTAFTCTSGLFQFRVLPFGVCNGPPTFQRLMEHVLSGLQWKICLLYLDDIIVFSKTFEQHVEQLSQVLTRIAEAGLKVAPKKCHFFQAQVNFLGHIVSKEGVATDPDKTRCVTEWPQPENIKHVRQFLGLCSYYRRYVKDFAQIAKPLHKLTEKDQRFAWTTECQNAFDKLKQLLTSSPILAYPIVGNDYVIDSDSSNEALGSVLSQVQDGKERVISYYSRSFTKQERNYCITRKELLAIVDSVKHFHHYLYGSKCLVRTDHGALTWLLKFKNPEGQLARWFEVLSQYDITIKFRPGRLNANADAISRIPCDRCPHCSKQEMLESERAVNKNMSCQSVRKMVLRSNTQADNDDSIEDSPQSSAWLTMKTPNDLRKGQMSDPNIKLVLGWKENHPTRPVWEEISHLGSGSKYYWSQWERLKIIDGVLYREWHDTEGDSVRLQLVLPEAWREEVMNLLHDNICAGHLGIHRTIARIRARFYWVGYKQDIINKCNTCPVCQAQKMSTKPTKAPLKPFIVGVPMERIQMDLIGPLPESYSGNKYALSLTCCFTKWIESFPLKSITAKTVASTLVDQFVCRFGVPREIHTDQGRQFESELFKELCELLDINKTRTTAFHPESDGLIERAQRTLEEMLSKYVETNQRNWDEILPLLLMAYRSSKHESTKMTPNMMMLGREIDLPVDLIYPPPPSGSKLPSNEYVVELQNKMRKVHCIARASLLEAGQKQKRLYDRKINKHQYHKGDAVWLRIYVKPKGLSKKLQLKWEGPFKIIDRISDLTFKIQKNKRSSCKIVHFNRLKPYVGTLNAWFTKNSQ